MTKQLIALIIMLLSFQTAFCQAKEIKGDTVYWFKWNKIIQRSFNLKDFEKSRNEFNFRIRDYGQIIEIEKDSSGISGYITNYTYHTKNANRDRVDTLFNKIILSPQKANSIYDVIIKSGILELPSDNKIKNWTNGLDGITYIIEHADKKNYWFKNYWTPTAQDSIPEAVTVLNFLKKLSDSLNLEEINRTFRNGLPKHGCYNSGGTSSICYASNTFELGYSGSTKLPVGFSTSYSATYIGQTKVNLGVSLQYNFNKNNFYHLNFMVSKWNLFYEELQFSDFIAYNYQDRKLDINWSNNKFQDHQIKYGLNLKNNFGVGAGVDYLISDHEKLGGNLYAFKYFSQPIISMVLSSSLFKDHIDYKAQIFKSFYLNRSFVFRRITLGLTHEEFMHYKDLCFNVVVAF